MDVRGFMETRWVKAAADPKTVARVLDELPIWMDKVQNSELIARAWRLWEYLTSGKCSLADIMLIAGALLYLISPIDAVPDFIPVAGWLDDVAIAGLVLGYLDKKAGSKKEQEISV
jgi:uncharacterized membrane protein YkvA (DUF1232 family)